MDSTGRNGEVNAPQDVLFGYIYTEIFDMQHARIPSIVSINFKLYTTRRIARMPLFGTEKVRQRALFFFLLWCTGTAYYCHIGNLIYNKSVCYL